MAATGVAAWAGGLVALLVSGRGQAAVLAVAVAVLLLLVRSRRPSLARLAPAVVGWLLVAAAVAASAGLRGAAVADGPVARLAPMRPAVEARLVVTSDPRPLQGRYGERMLLRGDLTALAVRGQARSVRAPVLVVGDAAWADVELGSTLRVHGRLAPADDRDRAAVLTTAGHPEVLAAPSVWWRGAATVRASIRDAVSARDGPERALVPALVTGDDHDVPEQVQTDFRTSGLTHLLAVSGTNLTLVVGFLLLVGRWCGVRGRWQYLLGALGIVGFVLLARTEPSVVRAAAMGTVALLGLGGNGRDRGIRALGVAVTGLLLWDPWLAATVGFALSVLATAGILFLAPAWTAALGRWLPGWAAQAVAVPLAAQLVCTPVVAALSGQVSLVAVVANLLAAPLVAPATVLGLFGGLVGLVVPAAGLALGWLAGACAAGIVAVAHRSATLALPAVEWSTSAPSLALLTVLCAGLAVLLGPLLSRRSTGSACCLLLGAVVVVPLPSPGWPPDGWVLAACDVGQGDALAVRAGPGEAVVVDAGPDPALVDRCLDRLDVERVPLLVLTHFHADHVDGLAGVYAGRRVGEVDVTSVRDPAERATYVAGVAGETVTATYGSTRTVGDVTLQVLGPPPGVSAAGGPNNASVVLLVEVRGVRLLLTGDVEPEAQAALARAWPGLSVDVLKIPHHGSRFQDLDFLRGLHAGVAVASVGEGNDYGHPSAEVLDPLADAGARVFRTDHDGTVVVTAGDPPRVVTED
ncbi:ComEC/Rec2 family competence protein [Nocardioides guangzhouensis]|uniref:ComEC/Rec2 family competence protein n=2 Tax=Nocardioides guangzhouensis TaxID=2497878 RepID=A0A4Q4ZFE9_9ACTN|nr:ComEC/Rec2 family competence protein [Nocardioides guangzhouensis]